MWIFDMNTKFFHRLQPTDSNGFIVLILSISIYLRQRAFFTSLLTTIKCIFLSTDKSTFVFWILLTVVDVCLLFQLHTNTQFERYEFIQWNGFHSHSEYTWIKFQRYVQRYYNIIKQNKTKNMVSILLCAEIVKMNQSINKINSIHSDVRLQQAIPKESIDIHVNRSIHIYIYRVVERAHNTHGTAHSSFNHSVYKPGAI